LKVILESSKVGALATTIMLLTAINVRAATYYVATNGSDNNACTAAQSTGTPKRSVASGLTCLRAGDTLYLRAGVYAEKIDSNSQTVPSGSSWSSPVTIAAYPGETATMRYGGGVMNLAANYIQYLVFDRIIFDAAHGGSCPVNDGCGVAVVSLWGGANHVRIQNSELWNSVGQGVTIFAGNGFSSDYNELLRNKIHDNGTSDFDHGIYMNTSGNVIDGNEIYNNAGWGVHKYPSGDNNVFRNNRIHHNARLGSRGDGVFLQGGSGNQIYNNVISANDNGIGTRSENNAQIYNNTITANRGAGVTLIGGSNTTVQNNILYSNASGQFTIYSGATYVFSSNLCSSAANGCSVVADPKFVNAASNDFHVLPGSPAIDSGMLVALVTTDVDGVARPSGNAYDIGAYEVGAITALYPPAPPTNVRVVR